MFDDLDPDFLSSPGPALPIVAARVYAIRRRRWIVAGSAVGAIAVFVLGSMAFGGGGKNPDRLTVSRRVTTTTEGSSNILKPLVTVSTSSTSTTVAATSTTATLPVATTTTSPKTTTTAPTPAHLTVAFDHDRLVIQSGTSKKISYTVTNDGGRDGTFATFNPRCVPDQSVWPGDQSAVRPVAWPVPVSPRIFCLALRGVTVPAHASRTLSVTIVAGLHDNSGNLVPSPPGDDSFVVQNATTGGGKAQLPVTITPPATPPLTITHPSEVTAGSNAQNDVAFTITNNLPFSVAFVEQGPCALGGEAVCESTFPQSARDLRVAPYDKADVPLWTTRFVLGAHETRMATASVNGVVDLGGDGSSGAPLPPGVYSFDWDGEKVKFTVT